MQSNLIEGWEEDGLVISDRYQEKIQQDGLNSAKSLGERSESKEFRFYSQLFEGVSIKDNFSILDIGCGKGELLTFLNLHYPEVKIDKYLGLDIVPAFIDLARKNYPQHQFQLQNFVSSQYLPDNSFNIVLAVGVLVSRVRNYTEYLEYFIDKMLQFSSRYVMFNLISEVDLSSKHYINYMEVGHSTTCSVQVIKDILNKFKHIKYTIVERKIFPDATDMFIRIHV